MLSQLQEDAQRREGAAAAENDALREQVLVRVRVRVRVRVKG